MTKLMTLMAPLSLVGLLACPSVAWAQQVIDSSAGQIAVSVVAEGIEHPWAIAFLPDGQLLVTERGGNLRVITDGAVGAPVAGVPEVRSGGQGGLLDVELAPDFADSGMIYLSYAEPGDGGAGTAVMAARLVLDGDSGRLEDQKVIFRMNRFSGSGIQFGARIVFDQTGNLLVTLGDRGDADRAQDFGDLVGGTVRIAPDGSVPEDNPKPEGWDAALFSKGQRNPQGATLAADGSLWTVDHGAQGGDELNHVLPGRNYGWPVISYGRNYDGSAIGEGTEKAGLEQPVYYWDPSIAPSGLTFYSGKLFPEWKDDLLLGALKFQMLVHLEMDGDKVVGEERLLEGAYGRIRDVREGPDGAIYLATDEGNGQILRLTPAE